MRQPVLLALKALQQLGPGQLAQYALYQLGLRTGHFRRMTKSTDHLSVAIRPLLALPEPDALRIVLSEQVEALLSEAGEILSGQVRLFGEEPVPLHLRIEGELRHWTQNQGLGNHSNIPPLPLSSARSVFDRLCCREGGPGGLGPGDIKFVWEPGRFGWAYVLGRAYRLSGDESYARGFWRFAEEFIEANPPYLGPHWSSAQEVALRILALVFASQVFAVSPESTAGRMARLSRTIATHAARIPPTLSYARAQNNNHLLSEAAGLYTAGLALPDHPQAEKWKALGWRWLNHALQNQIDKDGTYIQQSTNYHRLMLQVALWVNSLAVIDGRSLPVETLQRLGAASHWLLALVDRQAGQVPNLGPNDGALIQPLAACPFSDYRPVVQAACRAFLEQTPFPPGAWDEMAMWYGISDQRSVINDQNLDNRTGVPPLPFREGGLGGLGLIYHSHSWACLRAARFHSRPGHADQLHLDLWWRGLNVAQDAGTYLYNAPPPWDNSLARSAVHNTLMVDGEEQMTHAGRFLWLDWAQGVILSHERAPDGSWERLAAQHDGYRRHGLLHQRQVTAFQDGIWLVEDCVVPSFKLKVESSGLRRICPQNEDLKPHRPPTSKLSTFRLHWLLPDWPWEVEEKKENGESKVEIRLDSPYGKIKLCISTTLDSLSPQLTRAGELLYGSGPLSPTWGWTSPTYGCRIPALSFAVSIHTSPPVILRSEWFFPCTSF